MEKLKEMELPGELVIEGKWSNTFAYECFEVELKRAEGIYLYDTEGREYIDASGGPAAIGLGHGDTRVASGMAIPEQRFLQRHL